MEHENQHSEPELTPEERRLEQLLPEAVGVTPPTGLSDRVEQASIGAISGADNLQFEHQLDEACSYRCPIDLSTSVFAASVASLHGVATPDSEPVLARIGTPVQWRQVALAACLTFAALISIRIGVTNSQNTHIVSPIASNSVLSFEEEALLLEDLNLSEYAYLADTRELAFADVADSFNNMRADIELWQLGLLTE
jgi:hypothetical protein